MERLRVITLVHGTWATDAPWTHPQSKLSQALMQNLGPALILPFAWSGKNSLQARKRAAEDLKRHLMVQFENHRDADHFVIGHSHGGSVAHYAGRRPHRHEPALCGD